MRINKFLSTCGVASRRKCEDVILSGRVAVNGKIVSTLSFDVNEKKDSVTVDGVQVSLPKTFVYLKFNKPKGCTCTASDERGRKTIFDVVKSKVRLVSVGRLDYDTEGLLLLTNDGDFANMVTHPRFHFEKEYYVTIEGQIKESELAVLRKGVVENGVRMPEAKVKVLGEEVKEEKGKDGTLRKKYFTKLSVVIDEGQNHQVRRMFDCLGKSIHLLRRVRIGKVKLGGLSRGETKPLTEEEIESFHVGT